MVKEVTYFVAENDPEETRWSDPVDAHHHEDRLSIVSKLRAHIEGLYGARTEIGDITNQTWVEVVAIVQRETPT
jgi:hypothetical protein